MEKLNERGQLIRKMGTALFSLYMLPVLARPISVVAAPKNAALYDPWMSQWMSSKVPLGVLHVTRFADPIYVVTKHFGWAPDSTQAKNFKEVTVPEGFVTDFASIPRIFWSLLPPDGLYTYPAIIHDYLYWEQPISRADADEILRFAMLDFKVDSVTVSAIHKAVRLAGGAAWDENQRLKKLGEKRLLRQLPDDPTVRWADWKTRTDVF